MEKTVVSANYRDRGAANKWLARLNSNTVDQAVEVPNLILDNVEIKASESSEERGFGCRIVAVGDVALDPQPHDPKARAVYFDGQSDFYTRPDGEGDYVTKRIDRLYLQRGGSVLARLKD